jgi:hypothetical protein
MLNKFRSVSRVTETGRLFKNFKFLSLYPAERTGVRDNHHSTKVWTEERTISETFET